MNSSEFKLAIEALLRKGFVVGQFDEAIQDYRFCPTDKAKGQAA